MYYLVVLVLDDTNLCQNVMEAWEAAGAPGVTVLDSTGIGSSRKGLRDDIPLFPNLAEVFRSQEEDHRTVFSVVKGQEKVDALVEAVMGCVCGFNESSDTGFLFVVPVSQVFGNVFHSE